MSKTTIKPGDRADSAAAMLAQLKAQRQFRTHDGVILFDTKGKPQTRPISAAFLRRLRAWVKANPSKKGKR